MQLLANICYSLALFTIFSLSFYLIFRPTKIFHISHAFTISLGAYVVYFFYNLLDLSIYLSVLVAICASILFGIANELLLYKHLRSSKSSNIGLLVLSLGVYIVSQNTISILLGDDLQILSKGEITVGYEVWGAHVTFVQILTMIVAVGILLLTLYLWHKTKIGYAIRAISTNPELSQIFGIPKEKVILLSFVLGSLYAGLGGILVGFDTGITPTFGFSLLLYAIVIMIVGGVESIWGIVVGAMILAVIQNLTAYYLDAKWMDTITYALLIIFLVVRPYGVSGTKNKKVEI